jgi:hypothetical protein
MAEFKVGDRVRIRERYSSSEVADGTYPYSCYAGVEGVLESQEPHLSRNGYSVWNVRFDDTSTDIISDIFFEEIATKKITVWPLELTTDQAKSLIVWLMTDHGISKVSRDTVDGDIFLMESDGVWRN